jgi:NAD(P)H dehydrogenase (quinone)
MALQGCETAIADLNDPNRLNNAFAGAEGAFVMLPPLFDPSPGFPEAKAFASTLRSSLDAASPGRVVCLSTIGANVNRSNLLNQLGLLEAALGELATQVAFLRPAWFMENYAWDIPAARDKGVVPSFLQPLDRKIPMVATEDVGRVAAELLQETWNGKRIVELEGPCRLSPSDITRVFSALFGRPIRMESIPRETWLDLFSKQGMQNPLPRIQMLDGFNEGWIEFLDGKRGSCKGVIEIERVLDRLIHAAPAEA